MPGQNASTLKCVKIIKDNVKSKDNVTFLLESVTKQNEIKTNKLKRMNKPTNK